MGCYPTSLTGKHLAENLAGGGLASRRAKPRLMKRAEVTLAGLMQSNIGASLADARLRNRKLGVHKGRPYAIVQF